MTGPRNHVGPKRSVRIANSSGYFGDRSEAARELLDSTDIDVLTGDYLAELTMLILWKTQQRGGRGYVRTFLDQLEGILATTAERGIKVVTNAGGLDPAGLAADVRKLAGRVGVDVNVAHLEGDDVRAVLEQKRAAGEELYHLDTGAELPPGATVVTANAYLGGRGIALALDAGADIVVCPRVTDAALVIGPAASWHGWQWDDWDRLGSALVVGHVLECGPQTTGGNYGFPRDPGERLDDRLPGFPFADVADDGTAVISKPDGSGGKVTVGTVTAQLLYEIGGPLYANPDVVARFDTIRLEQEGRDRVRISGVRGAPPPSSLKVAVNLEGGYRNQMLLGLTAPDVRAKADLAEAQLRRSLAADGLHPQDLDIRLLGGPVERAASQDEATAFLRIAVRDPSPDVVGRRFSDKVVALGLSSYAGVYMTTPPSKASAYGTYWPMMLARDAVREVVVGQDGSVLDVPPATVTAADVELAETATERPHSLRQLLTTGGSEWLPLGTCIGARSGDKGGNANVGLWAAGPLGYAWLAETLTCEELRRRLPEAAELDIARHELPNLFALNFVIASLLGEGAAATLRPDAQAKGLGEYLRSQRAEIPRAVLAEAGLAGTS